MKRQFEAMRTAMDELDSDKMEEVIREMEGYSYNDEHKRFFEQLKNAVEDIDTEKSEEILRQWEKILLK